MKKALLIVALLLAVSPVMATVTITADRSATFNGVDANTLHRAVTVTVAYSISAPDGNYVRAFALDMNVDSGCTMGKIRDFNVGENNSTKQGYGIFPGRFRAFVNPATPDACYMNAYPNGNYNPTPAWLDPGSTGTGLDMNTVIVEMGYLGAGDANRPGKSGTLFKIDVNGYGFSGTAHLTFAADAMRGGVVLKDTNATTTDTNLPFTVDVCFPTTCVDIPNILTPPMTKAQADAAITAVGLVPNGTPQVLCSGTYNYVLSQDTGCVAAGTTVNYTYEAGITVLGEVGQQKAVAESAWTGQGFGVSGTSVIDCAHTAGVVLDQSSTGCQSLPYTVTYHYAAARIEPNVVGMTRAQAVSTLTAAGFTVITPDVNGWGGPNNVTTVGNVYATSPAPLTSCGSTNVTLSVVSYPIKYMTVTNSLYVNWQLASRPQCWAYPRQCHGDADGKKQGTWVSNPDLVILKSAVTKVDSLIPTGGRCADFDHKKQGTWISNPDLAILKAYVTKADSLVPLCGDTSTTADPNYWYFCLPVSTPATTCPAGQYCAPAGICPNTP